MTTYVPAKVSTQFVFFAGLPSQANPAIMQANPTIAAGDFQISIDGGALANLGTLPAVTPAAGKMVKFTLSTSEMAGANATIVCSDAAGAEWCDAVFNVQTATRQVDDLAFPATSGRSMVVDAAGLVDANAVKVGPTGSGTAQTTGDIVAKTSLIPAAPASTTNITAGTITTVTNLTNAPTAGDFTATMKAATLARVTLVDALTTYTGNTLQTGNVATLITTVGVAGAGLTAADDAVIIAIGALNNLAAGAAMTLTSGERNSIAAALLDLTDAIEAGLTVRQAMRLGAAADAGKVSGMATATVVIRNAVADSKDRITSTCDVDGNRTAITYDLT